MRYLFLFLSWFFSIIFGLLTLSMLLTRNWLQAIALFGVVLVLLPPVRALATGLVGRSIPWWMWIISIVVLLVAFVWLGSLNKYTSAIYNSPDVKARLLEMYDAKMEEWPVPYESVFVDTEYGRVHVIVSGPEDAPPVILFHASGVGGWSWLYNVEELNQHYRTYAIDTLGDVGRSELTSRDHYPQDGQAQAELYTNVADKLGIVRAYVVGASEGGFIGTNLALHAPERVEKLVLLGPMGYAGTTESTLRIMLAQFFPLKPIQDSTIPWAFGDDPQVVEAFGEWFRLLMTGTFPQKARPIQFTPEQRQSLKVPVLLVLGEEDHLVGDPQRAKALVQDIPDIRVEVLDTGHLIGTEQPEQVNKLILEFFEGR
jgi:pimeloyl-ACP methyl ester carboxylesterase